MKKTFLAILITSLTFWMSCKHKPSPIFEAIQKLGNHQLKIEIFEGEAYQMSMDESVYEQGSAVRMGDTIILSPDLESPIHTLDQHRKYRLLPDRMCELKLVSVPSEDTADLFGGLAEELNVQECFEVLRQFGE